MEIEGKDYKNQEKGGQESIRSNGGEGGKKRGILACPSKKEESAPGEISNTSTQIGTVGGG